MRTRARIHTLPDIDAFVQADTRIFASVGRRGVVAIDGSDLRTPRLFDPPQLQLPHAPWAIDADARRLVVAAGRELCVFDHGAGWPPALQSAFWLGGAGMPEDGGILLDGEIAWVASKGLLRAIELLPQEPRELGAVAIPEDVTRLARVEGDLVLLDPTGALVVVDVGDPATPRAKATIPLGLPMLNMAVEGRMLYLIDGGLLTTARLGGAGDLAPLGTIDLGLAVVGESSIAVRRSMVFVGGANGVRVIDASIPTALDEVGRLEGWPAGSLALHDDDRHMLLTGRRLGLSTEPWGVLSARFDPPATVTPDPSRPTPMATATPEATSTPRGTSTPSPSATATPVAPASPSADPSSEPSPTPAARLWLPWSLRITP
jgi:hypothetical protein